MEIGRALTLWSCADLASPAHSWDALAHASDARHHTCTQKQKTRQQRAPAHPHAARSHHRVVSLQIRRHAVAMREVHVRRQDVGVAIAPDHRVVLLEQQQDRLPIISKGATHSISLTRSSPTLPILVLVRPCPGTMTPSSWYLYVSVLTVTPWCLSIFYAAVLVVSSRPGAPCTRSDL